jgi:hypothetical protein
VADVDLANDEGVYVEIERFSFYLSSGRAEEHPIELRRFLEKVQLAGIEVPDTIYGFKASSAEKASSNPKMVPLWKWFEGAVKAYFNANPQFAQAFANRTYMNNEVDGWQGNLRDTLRRACKWASLPLQHPFRDLLAKLDVLCQYDNTKIACMRGVADMVHHAIPTTQPTYDISSDYKALVKRYPLMFKVTHRMDYHELGRDGWHTALEHYVAMVDLVEETKTKQAIGIAEAVDAITTPIVATVNALVEAVHP